MLWLLGGCCLTVAFTPMDGDSSKYFLLPPLLVANSLTKSLVQVICLITAEIYPTNLRAQALATGSFTGLQVLLVLISKR